MWSVTLASMTGAFLGSMVGMVYCLKTVTRMLHKRMQDDPELDKIEIKVVMNWVPGDP